MCRRRASREAYAGQRPSRRVGLSQQPERDERERDDRQQSGRDQCRVVRRADETEIDADLACHDEQAERCRLQQLPFDSPFADAEVPARKAAE